MVQNIKYTISLPHSQQSQIHNTSVYPYVRQINYTKYHYEYIVLYLAFFHFHINLYETASFIILLENIPSCGVYLINPLTNR